MVSFKESIERLITESSADINESDLDRVQMELEGFIDDLLSSSENKYFDEIKAKKRHYFLFRDKNIVPERVVIIGDIHCDFTSLAGILRKLCLSQYDYYGKAYFVFLGDYIDRGALPLQTFRLLFNLKKLLGERCVLLKGNHDMFYSDDEKKEIYSKVNPAETICLMNQFFKKETILKFKQFFDSLPYFLILERKEKRILFVHGGIPKDYNLDPGILSAVFNASNHLSPEEKTDTHLMKMLNSMLWGDPVNTDFKIIGSDSRFEFGSEQFWAFMKKYNFTHMIRGHEPKRDGFEPKYENHLYTVFSTGGELNENSFYSEDVPDPAFAVINENGEINPESIFKYKIRIEPVTKKNEQLHLPEDDRELQRDRGNIQPGEVTQQIKPEPATTSHLNPEFYLSLDQKGLPTYFNEKVYQLIKD